MEAHFQAAHPEPQQLSPWEKNTCFSYFSSHFLKSHKNDGYTKSPLGKHYSNNCCRQDLSGKINVGKICESSNLRVNIPIEKYTACSHSISSKICINYKENKMAAL